MLTKNRLSVAVKGCSDDTLRGIAVMLKDSDSGYMNELVQSMSQEDCINAMSILSQKGKGVKALPLVKQLVPLLFPTVGRKEIEMGAVQTDLSAVYTAWDYYITRNFSTPWGHITTEGIMAVFVAQQEAMEAAADEEKEKRAARQQAVAEVEGRLNSSMGGRVVRFMVGGMNHES